MRTAFLQRAITILLILTPLCGMSQNNPRAVRAHLEKLASSLYNLTKQDIKHPSLHDHVLLPLHERLDTSTLKSKIRNDWENFIKLFKKMNTKDTDITTTAKALNTTIQKINNQESPLPATIDQTFSKIKKATTSIEEALEAIEPINRTAQKKSGSSIGDADKKSDLQRYIANVESAPPENLPQLITSLTDGIKNIRSVHYRFFKNEFKKAYEVLKERKQDMADKKIEELKENIQKHLQDFAKTNDLEKFITLEKTLNVLLNQLALVDKNSRDTLQSQLQDIKKFKEKYIYHLAFFCTLNNLDVNKNLQNVQKKLQEEQYKPLKELLHNAQKSISKNSPYTASLENSINSLIKDSPEESKQSLHELLRQGLNKRWRSEQGDDSTSDDDN